MWKRRFVLVMSVMFVVTNMCVLALADHELDGKRCAETSGTCQNNGNFVCKEKIEDGGNCGGLCWWCNATTAVHEYDCMDSSDPEDECNWLGNAVITCVGPRMRGTCVKQGDNCNCTGVQQVGNCSGGLMYECDND